MQIRTSGIIEAILSATFFGLIPFFSIPLYQNGMDMGSVIFWRFFVSAVCMVIVMLYKKSSMRISKKALCSVGIIGAVYYFAAYFLFTALTFLASGIVTTLFFTNPIFVMILMVLFFKERMEVYKVILSLTAFGGVALLSGFFNTANSINWTGFTFSILAGFGYSVYVITINMMQKNAISISKDAMSLYIFTFATIIAGIVIVLTDTFHLPTSFGDVLWIIASGIFTTLLSNVLLISALPKIGTVLTSILGVMEPLTAVVIGIFIFHEPFTLSILLGAIIILISVCLLTIMPTLRNPPIKKIDPEQF